MGKDTYQFHNWVAHHGYGFGSGDFTEVPKRDVWDAIKSDPEFFKMKLYEIRVQYTDNSGTDPNSYVYPGRTEHHTERHWCKSLAEAKKISEVIKQAYPQPLKQPKVRSK